MTLTSKSIGHIPDSWRASALSFMIIGGLQGQLWSRNHFQSSMPHDLDLWTPKSIGHILDSWGASPWSFMIIGELQGYFWYGNRFQSSMPHDLDLWPFDPNINRAHPWLMESNCMKFHDHRWITGSVMAWKPFSIINAPWPWPLDPEINRGPWLMGSMCMKFHDHRWITVSYCLDLKINTAHPWLMGCKCMQFHYYISKGIWLTVRKPIVDARPQD